MSKRVQVDTNVCVKLSDRADQRGACFISYIAQAMAAVKQGFPVQVNKGIKYAESKIIKPLFKLFPPCDLKQVVSEVHSPDWIETLSKTVLLIKQDCLSQFEKSNWKSFWRSELQLIYGLENPWRKLKLKPSAKILCVHMRLADVTKPSYAAQHAYACRVTDDINNGKSHRLNMKDPQYEDAGQTCIVDAVILNFIHQLQKMYPEHEVHVVCAPVGICNLPFPIHRPDEDTALWLMANSDVLVGSRSTFALTAAYLHSGTAVYLPVWAHHAAIGLGSRYDQTHNKIHFFNDVLGPTVKLHMRTPPTVKFYSQSCQDTFAYAVWQGIMKQSGRTAFYYLDVGAYDGKNISNTYIFENRQEWKGICIEADTGTFQSLKANRPTAICVNAAITEIDGFIKFSQGGVGGTSVGMVVPDKKDSSYVDAVRLETLFQKCNVPAIIDFASFDIEGGEFAALKGFPFLTHKMITVTIEHNSHSTGVTEKNRIFDLMTFNDYVRIANDHQYTHCKYEDWYVHKDFYSGGISELDWQMITDLFGVHFKSHGATMKEPVRTELQIANILKVYDNKQ